MTVSRVGLEKKGSAPRASGRFSCPKCGSLIDLNDETETAYRIIDVQMENDLPTESRAFS